MKSTTEQAAIAHCSGLVQFLSPARKAISLCARLIFFLIVYCAVVCAQAESGKESSVPGDCVQQNVCLKVVSQRWLTDVDLQRLDPLAGVSIGVRLKLVNKSASAVYYKTYFESSTPAGHRFFKKSGETEWTVLPRRSKEEFAGEGFQYSRLAPQSEVEYELSDWSNPTPEGHEEEHAFSVFIRLGDRADNNDPIELATKPFVPLNRTELSAHSSATREDSPVAISAAVSVAALDQKSYRGQKSRLKRTLHPVGKFFSALRFGETKKFPKRFLDMFARAW
jgi:hypothetical protein